MWVIRDNENEEILADNLTEEEARALLKETGSIAYAANEVGDYILNHDGPKTVGRLLP